MEGAAVGAVEREGASVGVVLGTCVGLNVLGALVGVTVHIAQSVLPTLHAVPCEHVHTLMSQPVTGSLPAQLQMPCAASQRLRSATVQVPLCVGCPLGMAVGALLGVVLGAAVGARLGTEVGQATFARFSRRLSIEL